MCGIVVEWFNVCLVQINKMHWCGGYTLQIDKGEFFKVLSFCWMCEVDFELEKEDGANVIYLGKIYLNIGKLIASLYSYHEFHDHNVIKLWCETDDDRH